MAAAVLALGLALPEPLDARSSGGRSGARGGGHRAGSSGMMPLRQFGGGGQRLASMSPVAAIPVAAVVSPAQHAFISERYISFTHGHLFGSAPSRLFSHAGYAGEVAIRGAPVAINGETFTAGGIRYRVSGLDALGRRDDGPRERLQQLLASGRVTVQSTGIDKYGRTTGVVRVDGRDVAPSLRAQDVASLR